MAETNVVQLISALWEWVKQDAGNWLRALADPRGFLASLNIEEDATLIAAIRLSGFSIVLANLLLIPPELVYLPAVLTVWKTLADAVLEYVGIFITALLLRFFVALFRAKATFRGCLILCLVMSVYLVPKAIASYPLVSETEILRRESVGFYSDHPGAIFGRLNFIFFLILTIPLLFVIWYQFMRAGRYMIGAGRVKTFFVTLATMLGYAALQQMILQGVTEGLLQ